MYVEPLESVADSDLGMRGNLLAFFWGPDIDELRNRIGTVYNSGRGSGHSGGL